MRLLRLSEVEIGLNDRVFRHARLRALLLWLAAFCGDAVMFFNAITGKWKPGYIFGAAFAGPMRQPPGSRRRFADSFRPNTAASFPCALASTASVRT